MREGGREGKQGLASELSFAWWRLCCFCFFTKIKMKELIWKRCWGITVIDAYKLQEAAALSQYSQPSISLGFTSEDSTNQLICRVSCIQNTRHFT